VETSGKEFRESTESTDEASGWLTPFPVFELDNIFGMDTLNLDNLMKRAIAPALSRCTVCKKQEDEHKPEGHAYQRDNSLPHWHGWHAFRRGVATNLHHDLGVDDKTIQAILRHSNIGITQNIDIKSVNKRINRR
jgi:hypothetical protein